MKKTLLSTLLLVLASLGAFAQNVNIPDANFKAYLVGNSSINTNSDNEIQVSEAAAFTGTIMATNLNISDLTGVEAFTAATQLVVSQNNLQSLDISQNTALIGLVCHSNNLSALDVSHNTALTVINCSSNSISSLDVSSCPDLTYLNCWTNNINSLDVSFCPDLTSFYCAENDLTYLNMKNITVSVIENTFNATNNPNLTCIEVDNPTEASTYLSNNIDVTASFNTTCSNSIVYIPDANFKALLVGNSAVNTNSDSEIQVSEAVAFTGQISITQFSGVTDLTGIEAFTNLTTLQCLAPNLGTVNVSQNTALTLLNLRNTNLNSIDVSQNTALTSLLLENNNLTSIDVSANTSLIVFRVSNNNVNNIDISQNSTLQYFACDENSIGSLDVSQNTSLVSLECDMNNLTSLNMKNISTTTLTTFDAANNPNLTCIEVDDVADAETNWTNIDATASFSLSCNTLGINNENELQNFHIYPNPVTTEIHLNTTEKMEFIHIYDATGNTVKVLPNPNSVLDVSQLKKGVYTLQIQTDRTSVRKKIMVE